VVEGSSNNMITIGQLAAYAGVTIKAVRHYHQRGLLEEPPRDSSGYRRYGARDAIDLLKIKTLASAGVPLARVKDLLAAGSPRRSPRSTATCRNRSRSSRGPASGSPGSVPVTGSSSQRQSATTSTGCSRSVSASGRCIWSAMSGS
jgi:DNA-binding transcriptional MerR regulator